MFCWFYYLLVKYKEKKGGVSPSLVSSLD